MSSINPLQSILAILLLVCSMPRAGAAVRLHPTFSNNAVLQRGMPVPIWGTAAEGETVAVMFAGQSVSTVATQGRWRVTLAPLQTSNQGATLRAVGPQNEAVIQNVVVGEVWICSGQSNMEWPMTASFQSSADIAASTNSNLRLFHVAKRYSPTPLTDLDYAVHAWSVASPVSVQRFSAVGYYFGRQLESMLRDQGVPVGIIHTSASGSAAHSWIREDVLRADPEYTANLVTPVVSRLASWQVSYDAWNARKNAALAVGESFTEVAPSRPWQPAELYNGMLTNLMPYAIQGAIWYQGEADAHRAWIYRRLLADLIRNWRQSWGQGDFSFFAVQLPGWDRDRMRDLSIIAAEVGESEWAELREAQYKTVSQLPKMDVAIITDLGEKDAVHPLRKQPVGERLARLALSQVYGVNIPSRGPRLQSLTVNGTNAVLRFSGVEQGLTTLDGTLPSGFTLAGADRGYYPAFARISATNEITIYSPQVSMPVAVRHGWNDFPVINLVNSAFLPASPFRTDNWPTSTEWKRLSTQELAPFTQTLSASFFGLPAQTLSYSLVQGPAGLAISKSGVLTWTPTEAQGPASYQVIVQVTNTASPPSVIRLGLVIAALESNAAPLLAPIPTQTVDELSLMSLSLADGGTDSDLPLQRLNYSLVSGPPGLQVGPLGTLNWIPGEAQGPGTYTVTVQVKDNGTPSYSATREFTVIVNEVADPLQRMVWQIGTDDNPAGSTYRPSLEFSTENGRNDLLPGRVTRQTWDPEFVSATNPAADDDFYFAGSYPTGFNGLLAPLNVPNDEPPIAWERAHTASDTTNRIHFILSASQVAALSSLQLSFELVSGGSAIGGTVQPGFGDHDIVVRFRNTAGTTTQLLSQRVSQTTNIALTFAASSVGAMEGPNTVEIVRTGPSVSGVFYWIQYDYLRLESRPVGNTTPLIATPPNRSTDELVPLTFAINATDTDVPAQSLTYTLVSGPVGLTVSSNGTVAWTPTEDQGPGSYPVVVRVTDNGIPPAKAEANFSVSVNEANGAPVLAAVPNQVVDELSPLSLALSAMDSDLPLQGLSYSLVSGPQGLTVSPAGALTWTPTEAQGPGNYSVVVQVTDNGHPVQSDTRQFTIEVNEVADPVMRTVWEIGNDNNPTILPYRPSAEFSQENNRNDLRPGRVTRMSGDPEFVALSNPTADDDFYFRGTYSAGFNGLLSALSVPNDEPPIAWERAHTGNDTTNRVHFLLEAAQVTAQSSFKLSLEWVNGGSSVGGVVQTGFAIHDFVVRFRNPVGETTQLLAQRVNQTTNLLIEFAASTVGALAGANTIEIVRTGPTVPGVSYWIQYDYLRLESRPVGNTAPTLATPSDPSVEELTPFALSLSATDADLPAQTLTYSLVSGPEGLTVSPTGAVAWTPTESDGPGSYPVVVRVTDQGIPPASAETSFRIEVTEVNFAPVWTTVPHQTTDEFIPFSFTLNAADADLPAQALIYSLVSGPEGLTVNEQGELIWTPAEAQGPGTFPVVVRVTDAGSPSASAETGFSITVNEVNTAPVLVGVADQTSDELSLFQLTLSAADSDVPAQNLTYSLLSGPEGLTISPTGALAWTPTEAQGPGSYTVVFRVTDHGTPPLNAETLFSVTVSEVNATPVLTEIAPQTVDELSLLQLSLNAADSDLPVQSLSYALVSGPEGLTVTEQGELAWTPTEAQGPGSFNVVVEVSDDGIPPKTAETGFAISVNEVAALPVLRQYWSFNETNALLSPQQGSGAAGITVLPGPTTLVQAGVEPAFEGVNSQNGSGTATHLRILEPIGAEIVLRLPTTGVMDAVVRYETRRSIQGPGIQQIEYTADGVAFLPLITFPVADHAASLVELDFSSLPVTDNNPEFALRITFAAGEGGTTGDNLFEDLTLYGRLLPGFETSDFPQLSTAGTSPVESQEPLALTLSGIDPDADPETLTFQLISGPPELTVSPEGEVAWTPDPSYEGSTVPVVIRVTDNSPSALHSLGRFDLSVHPPNSPPTLDSVDFITTDEQSPLIRNLSGSDSDSPAQTLTFSLVSGPSGLAVSPAGRVEWTPGEDQGPGTFDVVVRVTDSGPIPRSAETEFSISVREVNANPSLAEIPNQTVNELSPLSLMLGAADTDLPAQSLTYSLVSGPDGLTVSEQGELAWTPTEAQALASYLVVVRVTDNGTPPASVDAGIFVWALEVNAAPVLAGVANQTVDELSPLALTLSATDTDLPAQSLTYDLVSGPDGLMVSEQGELAWTPTESQGPDTYPVVVRVTDDGTPPTSVETGFSITVNEANTAPVLAAVANQTVDELSPLLLSLTATDTDLPEQTLTYSLVNGPDGLTVTASGLVAWTPTEAQGASNYPVVVRVTDNATHPGSAETEFTILVVEGSAVPVFTAVANQTVDELSPLVLTLSATDTDLPAQTLTYSLVSRPEGLTVSPSGALLWMPMELQGPGVYPVVVRVTDSGTPSTSAETAFSIAVNEVADPVLRTVWQVGTNDNPAILPYRPVAEFSSENFRNDLPPGKVTRLPGDPELVLTNNPTADDDFYFQGIYPGGFNGLVTPLNVPNDEPTLAWERALTNGDRTNRIHFLLGAGQVMTASSLRLSFELVGGGFFVGGVLQSGFTDHDIVVRFRNANGLTTDLFSARVSQTTNIVLNFTTTSVAASAGPNTIEVVRTGPNLPNTSYFIQFDYLRLESQPAGNTPPTLATPADRIIDELTPHFLTLNATDTDLPAQTLTYSLVSGPDGLTVSSTGLLAWMPTEAQGPGTYPVVVQVSDNGFPIRSDSKQFSLQVNEVADPILRTLWLVGTDHNPAILPYRPSLEFSSENNRNDLPPGKVTRLTGDPELVQTNNPTADDDFFFQGIYPAGFNGLLTPLNVPNDEPALAWERALTNGDRTNRIHFLLGAGQVTTASSLRLSFEFVSGGFFVGGVLQSGFADHDIVVRFRNANGLVTDLFSARVSQTTNIVLNFTTARVAASAGPNSIEVVRTGPTPLNTSYFIQFDYLRLESLSSSAPTGTLGLTLASGPSTGRNPTFAKYPALAASLRHGVVSIQGVNYLTLTYDEPAAPSPGVRYLPEATSDLIHWSEAPVELLGIQTFHDHRSTTVRDTIPLGTSETRFLRVRRESASGPSPSSVPPVPNVSSE